jgi:cytochrome c556
MRKLLLTGFVAAFAFAGWAPAQAQSADAAIAARKAGMDLVAAATGAAKRAVDAKDDVKALKGTAEAIAAWGKAAPGLFVPGSDKGDTKALPVAFSDHDGLVKAGMALNAAGLKLSAAAEANDKAAFATAFGEVGAACGGCHRTYRAR